MSRQTSPKSFHQPVNDHDLIHTLNQRYHQQWQRAEALQAELDDIRHSRIWRILDWLRQMKHWFIPSTTATNDDVDMPTSGVCELDTPPTSTVSLIIPFRDRLELLRGLLRSLSNTDYKRYEIILVDNGSQCRKTLAYLQRLKKKKRIRIIRSPGSFHFAKLCNLGANVAKGDFFLFLNNDMKVIESHWLQHLLQLGERDDVGVVGATLLYPDGTVQHAGIYPRLDSTNWEHRFRGLFVDNPDNSELQFSREVPAVTGACLLIRRTLFRKMNGFSLKFPVTGNDVDLCLRVRQADLRVVLSAHAKLMHFESLSRGYSVDKASQQLTENEV